MSYSIDIFKKAVFLHESMNVLDMVPLTERDEEWVTVKEYFDKRMKDLDQATKR